MALEAGGRNNHSHSATTHLIHLASNKSESPRMTTCRNQSKSPPRLTDDRAQSKSPQRVTALRAQSKSPPCLMADRVQSKSPQRVKERRPQSKSPPRLTEERSESKSPQRVKERRPQSKSPPRLTEERSESTSPPRSEGHKSRSESKSPLEQLNEGMTQMTFTGRSRQRDSSDPQSAGSEKTQNSGRTRGKHRRATPTPSQRPAPAESDLHAACWTRNMAAVKRILSQDQSDIDGGGGLWGMTPVMTAAFEGQVDVVELLVSEGADVSLVNEVGNNTLHCACIGGDVETVKCVLSLHVVDINSRGWESRTPVMFAAWEGHRDVVELLVSEGADLSLVDEVGNNTLHLACLGGDVETVKYVLSLHVADINSRGERSRTPVMFAAWMGHRDVVKLLVSEGADVSLVDEVGDNILHLACGGGDVETEKFVLSQNVVDIDARNNFGQTAADVARHKGHQEVVKLL